MRITGCFLEYDGKFPILLRHPHKSAGDTWGLPAGKAEPGESDEETMLRELFEETSYRADISQLEHLGEFNFGPPERPYTFVTYRIKLTEPFKVIPEEKEHADVIWVTAQECYDKKNLIPDFHELLELLGFVKKEQEA